MPSSRWQFLRDHLDGLTDAEIASRRGVSPSAVSKALGRLMRQAGVRNRCQLGAWAAERGIVSR